MKISEKLSEIKQKECEIMRLFGQKDNVCNASLDTSLFNKEKTSNKELEKRYRNFEADKVDKIKKIDKKIDQLRNEIIEGKSALNKINVEKGIDKLLLQIKYDRIELSKLMRLAIPSSYRSVDIDSVDKLGINKRLKEVEARKNALDAEVQHLNWTHDV